MKIETDINKMSKTELTFNIGLFTAIKQYITELNTQSIEELIDMVDKDISKLRDRLQVLENENHSEI